MNFVRINKPDHPMHGMIGTVNFNQPEDGFLKVTLLNSSFQASFKPEDLQPIQVGTKVIVEHTVSDFFRDSMMIAGGWTPLTRILNIVEQKTPLSVEQVEDMIEEEYERQRESE